MPHNYQSILPFVFVGALVVFGMYRRVRRTVGLQKLLRGRLRTRIIIFAVVAALLLVHAVFSLYSAIAVVVGVVIGTVMAVVGMRTTGFEERADVLYYRPNAWLGVALVVVLVGRIVYRFAFFYGHMGQFEAAQQAASGGQVSASAYTNDPLIEGLFFIICSYYILYYGWLLRRGRALPRKVES